MKEKVLAPLRAFPRFAVFMYLLGLVSLMVVHQGGRHVSVFELVVDVYVVCLVLYLLPKRVARVVKALFAIIAYGLALIDMYCFCRLGAPINASLLRLCLETNQREAAEALASYVSLTSLPFPVILILLLMVVHLLMVWRKVTFRLRTFSWVGIGALVLCMIVSAKNKHAMFLPISI